MKYVLAIMALLVTADSAVAEEYNVTGVLCKKKEDLVGALLSGNDGTFLPDALAKLPNCVIILKNPVPVGDVEFLDWVPAGILKVRVYKGSTAENITNDSDVLVPSSSGEWFFTPTEESKIPLPKISYPVVPT